MADPFQPITDLVVEFVDSAAGSRKTLTAVAVSLKRAREEQTKTLFSMPTLKLVEEMVEVARRPGDVPVVEITSREDEDAASGGKPRKSTTTALLYMHLTGKDAKGKPLKNHPKAGHLLFITHETFLRMGGLWPPETAEFEIVIDEVLEVVLTRQPFRLHDSAWVLTSFLEVEEVTVSPLSQRARRRMQAKAKKAGVKIFTARDVRMLAAFEIIVAKGEAGSSIGEVEQAKAHVKRLRAKQRVAQREQDEAELPDLSQMVRPYFEVRAKDPMNLFRRVKLAEWDDVYASVSPVGEWLMQGASLFSDWEAWTRMVAHFGYGPMRGRVTISGFRRPESLKLFARVTMMSALFQHTMLYDIWSQLGVEFKRSMLVKVDTPTTSLGSRTLRIYWVTDQGWSKRLRDRSGGIGEILKLIIKAGVIARADAVCICTNKDDATEAAPAVVRDHFPNAVIMPHNSKGQNRFRHHSALIHTAALNAYTPDIRWLETVLGIDSHTQRIARTGQEVYQSLMRLSLRDPRSTADVTLVVMDQDVAVWLPQWFSPTDQVEVIEIDSSGVVKRKKSHTGRPALGEQPMTNAERQRRWRQRRDDEQGDVTEV